MESGDGIKILNTVLNKLAVTQDQQARLLAKMNDTLIDQGKKIDKVYTVGTTLKIAIPSLVGLMGLIYAIMH